MPRQKKRSPLDEMQEALYQMPAPKKEGFVLLVRSKTRRDLRAMKMQAVREGEDDMVRFFEACETLRAFVEAGIPLQL